ncbi:MAG: efflux RND transporter periplasmic adaptor subunit [Deltaproteobacteria bacterium]|nr:efflux RND transporter periplasmic adaptor subunit [Deltaproteobacteria bacterium]
MKRESPKSDALRELVQVGQSLEPVGPASIDSATPAPHGQSSAEVRRLFRATMVMLRQGLLHEAERYARLLNEMLPDSEEAKSLAALVEAQLEYSENNPSYREHVSAELRVAHGTDQLIAAVRGEPEEEEDDDEDDEDDEEDDDEDDEEAELEAQYEDPDGDGDPKAAAGEAAMRLFSRSIEAKAAPTKFALYGMSKTVIMLGVTVAILALIPFPVSVKGKCVARATRQVTVHSAVSGRIATIDVRVGQHVKAGQVLFRIAGEATSADLAVLDASLARARSDLQRVQRGATVEEIRAVRKRYAAARTRQALKGAECRRVSKNVRAGLVARETLIACRSALTQLRNEAAEFYAALRSTARRATPAELTRAKAEIDRLIAERDVVLASQSKLTVKSPISGMVQLPVAPPSVTMEGKLAALEEGKFPIGVHADRPFDEVVGRLVSAGEAVMSVVEIGKITVEIEVAEKHADAVRPGARALVRFASMPDRDFHGQVSTFSPAITKTDMTHFGHELIARVELENDDRALRPGMSGAAEIVTPPQTLLRQILRMFRCGP